MDSTDRKILRILQRNGRLSIKTIGEEVNLTSPAVSERIKKMESLGIIEGYYAKVDKKKLNMNICAYIGVDVPRTHQKQFDDFCFECENILDFHKVIGDCYAFLYVGTESTDKLHQLMLEIKKYGTTRTSIVIDTPFENKPI